MNVSGTDVFASVRFRTALGSAGLSGDVTATVGGEDQQFGFSRNADPVGIDVTETFPFEFPNSEGETGEIEAFVEVGDGLAAETDTQTFTVGESGGGEGESSLTLGDLSVNCSIPTGDYSPGDTTTVFADIEGFAPPGESYEVDVDLYSNGAFTDTLTEGISPNGAGSGEFEVELPTEGNYDFGVELSNLRRV